MEYVNVIQTLLVHIVIKKDAQKIAVEMDNVIMDNVDATMDMMDQIAQMHYAQMVVQKEDLAIKEL